MDRLAPLIGFRMRKGRPSSGVFFLTKISGLGESVGGKILKCVANQGLRGKTVRAKISYIYLSLASVRQVGRAETKA